VIVTGTEPRQPTCGMNRTGKWRVFDWQTETVSAILSCLAAHASGFTATVSAATGSRQAIWRI